MKVKTLSVSSLLLIGIMASCGQPSAGEPAPSQQTEAEMLADARAMADESNGAYLIEPLGAEGQEVTSIAEADLPFKPIMPEGLGPSDQLRATVNPVDPLEAQIAWVFQNDTLGHFVVFERVTVPAEQQRLEHDVSQPEGCTSGPATQEQQDAFGEGATATACHLDIGSVVVLKNGTKAVLVDEGEHTNLIWQMPLEPSTKESFAKVDYDLALEIRVVGPVNEFTPEQAVSVGNHF